MPATPPDVLVHISAWLSDGGRTWKCAGRTAGGRAFYVEMPHDDETATAADAIDRGRALIEYAMESRPPGPAIT